jgi:hypothetical protein
MTMTNCQKGAYAEMLFCAQVGFRGWEIYMPIGHAQTADVCIFKPPCRPVTVQVKTASIDHERGGYGVMASRGKRAKTAYAVGDFDILAAWLPDIEEFVLWRFDEICERKRIRYSPKRHRAPSNWQLLEELVTT